MTTSVTRLARRWRNRLGIATPNTTYMPRQCHWQILDYINRTSAHFKKTWCFPAQETILEALKRMYGLRICRRTLNYHLARAEFEHLLIRIRRHKRGPDGRMEYHSTVYEATWRQIQRMGKSAKALAGILAASSGFDAKPHVQKLAQYLNHQFRSLVPASP